MILNLSKRGVLSVCHCLVVPLFVFLTSPAYYGLIFPWHDSRRSFLDGPVELGKSLWSYCWAKDDIVSSARRSYCFCWLPSRLSAHTSCTGRDTKVPERSGPHAGGAQNGFSKVGVLRVRRQGRLGAAVARQLLLRLLLLRLLLLRLLLALLLALLMGREGHGRGRKGIARVVKLGQRAVENGLLDEWVGMGGGAVSVL